MLKSYYNLTKPGIIYGNMMTALASFFLASRGQIDFALLAALLFGLSFIIAASCVFNNYLDRDIDRKMDRTSGRALVKGEISKRSAIAFASTLMIVGIVILGFFTNTVALLASLVGAIVYILFYTPLKRRTHASTLIGSISGAAPIVVGYTAVTGIFDLAAFLLFLIMVVWQMPHFYSIAIYRREEYASASLPVLSVEKGIETTKTHVAVFTFIFLGVAVLPAYFHVTGYVYGTAMVVVGIAWIWLALKGFRQDTDATKWARKMFGYSLMTLTLFSILLATETWLP